MPVIAILIIAAAAGLIGASKIPAAKSQIDSTIVKAESYIPSK